MSSAKKALLVLVVATLGIWGCAQGQAPGSASSAERLRSLEAKCAKLEDDFRAAATVRDQVRKKLTGAEEQLKQVRVDLDQQVQTVTRERDGLKQQLTAAASERDAMVTQYEQFRKNIRELLGQAEASLPRANDNAALANGR